MPEQPTELPITLLYWLAASTPILVLLVLLVWRRWSSSSAAPVALAAAVLVALLLFRTPFETLAAASGKGIWDSIFVLYVIWPALILYNVADDAEAFVAMQRGVRRLMPDRLLVVLAFGWVLSSFIQSIAGFGTPLAVTTPLLIGLGVQPVYAVVLPIIGAAWANAFGSLGATWLATLSVVSLPNEALTLRYAASLLWIPNLLGGLAVAWMYGRWWAIRRGGPAILVISLIHSGLLFWLLPHLPTVACFLATSAALLVTFVLNRWAFYRQHDENEPDLIFTEEAKEAARREHEEEHRREGTRQRRGQRQGRRRGGRNRQPEGERMPMPLWLAFAPYIILGLLAVIALVIPPVNAYLERVQIGLPFPATTTGYGVGQEATEAYAAFAPLTHPGTLLLISAVVGYLLYSRRGLYPAGKGVGGILSDAAREALPATTAIAGLILISKVMDHSGEITVLALGIAAIAPSTLYVALSPWIGILGSFITSSNTASNVLFAPLQATAAQAEGIATELAIAGQTVGGSTGNAIAPGDALLGATVAGIAGSLGAILQRAIVWTLVCGLFLSLAALGLYLLL